MGNLESDEWCNHCDFSQKNSRGDSFDVATQQLDSQLSPGGASEGDGADETLNIMDTLPFDDTYLLVDTFETQMADLAAETQVVDLAAETQVLDLYEESQMEDLYGDTQEVETPGKTQVLDDFNVELCDVTECGQTNKTDVLCETQRLSEEEECTKTNDCDPVKQESIVDKDPPRKESRLRGFTSIRAASIRASGLAALGRGASRDLSITSIDNKSSLEQQSSELVGGVSKSGWKSDQEFIENGYNFGTERKLNKYKIGIAAVRKLFGEDQDAEVGKSKTETNQTDDDTDKPCLAGLSYANSQEQGELSQARALEVVDRFLDLNFLKDDEGFGKSVQNIEKLKVVSAAKGSRDLARKSTLQNSSGECGIYDWNDAREDDGGGEFFLKKKELFFDKEVPKQRCLTETRNSKSFRCSVDKREDCTKTKLGDLVYSDSGLLHKAGSKKKMLHSGEEVVHKNLIKNLDEQFYKVSGPEFLDNGAHKDIPDMRNIGPDTQMAAEAMGDLCFEVHLADNNRSGDKGVYSMGKAAGQNKLRNRTVHSEEHIPYSSSAGVVTRQAKRTKRISLSNDSAPSLSPNQCSITKKKHDRVLGEAEQRSLAAVSVSTCHGTESTGRRSEKCYMEDQLAFTVPVANRTWKSTNLNCSKVAANPVNDRDATNNLVCARASRKRTAARERTAITMTIEKIRKVGLSQLKRSNKTFVHMPRSSDITVVGDLKGERSRQETLADTRHCERLKSPSEVATSIPTNEDKDHSNDSPPCLDSVSRKISSTESVNARNSIREAAPCNSDHLYVKSALDDAAGFTTSKKGDETYAKGAERNGRKEGTPKCGTSACATPATHTTLGYDVSPSCKGDGYHKQSCRRNLSALSLMREIDNLRTGSREPYFGSCEPYFGVRESRKRKNITTIRVLFSQHLDEDVVKKQKKILARLGGALASSMSDATHFVVDEFVRTRNMLEAIASGKPVVTCSWIESCAQASCLIDEKNYILRDAKKEKEFGFCLPVSLARACQHPLLQGQKVLVTPNTKPSKDILANLVKAVHGQPIERLGRSARKDEKLPDDILILSCEEDYEACVPFLEKGGDIYSSELLLNGIVKQKLEYERHRLFADHVKRTRSTIWLKKRDKFLPVKNEVG